MEAWGSLHQLGSMTVVRHWDTPLTGKLRFVDPPLVWQRLSRQALRSHRCPFRYHFYPFPFMFITSQLPFQILNSISVPASQRG